MTTLHAYRRKQRLIDGSLIVTLAKVARVWVSAACSAKITGVLVLRW